jgi:hypothetical protein
MNARPVSGSEAAPAVAAILVLRKLRRVRGEAVFVIVSPVFVSGQAREYLKLPQARKGAKRYRVSKGFSLRLGAFAGEDLLPRRCF